MLDKQIDTERILKGRIKCPVCGQGAPSQGFCPKCNCLTDCRTGEKVLNIDYGIKSKDDKFFKSLKWSNLRDRVFNRDDWKCKACGTNTGISAHHIKPRSKGGKNVMKNLATLCCNCHDKMEVGEDIYKVEPKDEGIEWHEWVYGGGAIPKYRGER